MFGLSLSGCVTLATIPPVADAIDVVAPLVPEGDIEHYSCADFHSESLCEYGIGNYEDGVDSGGTYGEPYFDMMEQIRPVRHAIDLYKDDGYINIRKQANYSNRVTHYIDFNDENTLYYYHAADVFIPFSEE